MRETKAAVSPLGYRSVRPENGRFPGDCVRLTDCPRNLPENPLRCKRLACHVWRREAGIADTAFL